MSSKTLSMILATGYEFSNTDSAVNMASADDRVPLLSSIDSNRSDDVSLQWESNIRKNGGKAGDKYTSSWRSSNSAKTVVSVSAAVASTLDPGATVNENVVCVFVVAFDIRAGNMIEWCQPANYDLTGIEFKAMASGSHRINKDFIYFKKDKLFGFACFENKPIESEIERGARMKSVGILSTSYSRLHLHMEFLEDQVRKLLQNPGHYDELQTFYEKWKAVIPTSVSSSTIPSLRYLNEYFSDMKMTHPANCFSQFVKFFGEQIFILWKFALLQKRLLFFSPPPVGVVCYRVYCLSCLALHNVPEFPDRITRPLFYVNIADTDWIESQLNYVACTTEKIFESKHHLYDMYIDNQNIKVVSPLLRKLTIVTSADRDKLQRFYSRLREFTLFELGENEDEESRFVEYFTQLNSQLFRTLLDVSYSSNKQLTGREIQSLGLDPVADRQFLLELFETYNLDITLDDEFSCCSQFTIGIKD